MTKSSLKSGPRELEKTDPQIAELIELERKRQAQVLEMIPSENYVSPAILQALASPFINKYAEGYPGARYYQGNKYADQLEELVRRRALKLFGVVHANVQPLSGSPANTAIYLALLNRHDKIMGLELASGGHLTHGHPKVTFSGTFYKPIQITANPQTGLIDYDEVRQKAQVERPKLLMIGTTAYPRVLDFRRFAQIADSVGAYLVADISHLAGLVIAGLHPNPAPYAHVIMTTTHKTLRGPRAALIMVTKKGKRVIKDLAEKIDRAVFPGLQGGPHLNTLAAMGVALKEAESVAYKTYIKQVVENSKRLALHLKQLGFKLVSGGTDNHIILMDLSGVRHKVDPEKKISLNGALAAHALEEAGIIVNKNSIPGDKNPPLYPSGIRLGTPAVTSRGMKLTEMKQIAEWISLVLNEATIYRLPADKKAKKTFIRLFRQEMAENEKVRQVLSEVKALCQKFPAPGL